MIENDEQRERTLRWADRFGNEARVIEASEPQGGRLAAVVKLIERRHVVNRQRGQIPAGRAIRDLAQHDHEGLVGRRRQDSGHRREKRTDLHA